ncbi:MAG TPA: M3 family metallopeptidase [Parasegetibacter sp.]
MKFKHLLPAAMIASVSLLSCGTNESTNNPLLAPFDTPFGVPPFDKIKNEHFKPAYEVALKQHEDEIAAIVSDSREPDFENTILALENAGKLLSTVSTIFGNLNGAHTNDTLQAIAREMAPVLSAHRDNIMLNAGLFAKVDAVWKKKDELGLNAEQHKLLEKTYKGFVRSGANLSDAQKDSLRAVNAELSLLTVKFGQNLLAENNSFELVIENKEDLAGLPEGLIAAAAQTAKEKGKEGKWVFTLSNPSVMPFLQYAQNRELRKKIWEAYAMRSNNGNDKDNNEILVKIANLRLKKANMLGYPTHAHYVLEESMAKNPENVLKLLKDLWTPALAKAKQEAYDIQQEMNNSFVLEGNANESKSVEPYDWRYYAEIIRQKRFAINEEEIKPYFSLDNVRQGAFDVAGKLWGLTFKKLENVPVYHPEVEVYEVFDKDESRLGILYADFFPRASKRGGAWMTSYRSQKMENGKRVEPIISIVCNFTKPVGDKPSLLTFDEATTLFHEFGHALHGLLSNVTYESLAGTSVPRDFVELPSQVMENWAADPEVLKTYAKHYQTGEPIPDELIAKLEKAGTFDQGFATVEYLAASLLDMDYHSQTSPISVNAKKFEEESMNKIGLIKEIIPRYKSTYFQHIFSGGYSAGYYSYIWSEVLDSDAFAAFKESGNLYDPALAEAFRINILERGGTGDPMEMYKSFRGKEPDVKYLVKKRGL